jgi:hypothetical protein
MNVTATLDSGREQRAAATLALCFLTAVIEGMDSGRAAMVTPFPVPPRNHGGREISGLRSNAAADLLLHGLSVYCANH